MYPHHLHKAERPQCDCLPQTPRGARFVEIIILRQEIVHDIEAEFHLFERTRHLEETPVRTNESDDYTISRLIDQALDKALRPMTPYLLLPSAYAHRIANNHTTQWEEKSVYIAMPQNWPPHCIDILRDAVHNYIVKSVVLELLQIAHPADPYSQICAMHQERCYNDIVAIINTRLGTINISPSFLG